MRLPTQRCLPLLRFGVNGPLRQTALATGTAQLIQFTPLWHRAAYEAAVAVVHDFIATGDIYQANLTFPLRQQPTAAHSPCTRPWPRCNPCNMVR